MTAAQRLQLVCSGAFGKGFSIHSRIRADTASLLRSPIIRWLLP